MENIEIFKTDDGSIGLYNKDLDEIYHSKFGAKKEAMEKFIEPCMILDEKNFDILDICYGIGYNTKCALKCFKKINSIDCLEIDRRLVLKSFEFEFDEKINKIIDNNIKTPDFIHFYIDDARISIKNLNKKYDVIFHDGFTPYKQAILWSEEFIKEIALHLKKDGIYVTYNHSKPVLNALYSAGLYIGKTIKEGKIIGTVASFNSDLIQNPLEEVEIAQLNTKSAITYKDKNFNLSHKQIVENREFEVKNSKLESLSHYLKYSKYVKKY